MGVVATALFSEAALRFVLLGAATGALTALVALGIVLVYRTSGVLNFSAGALGGIGAFVCYDVRGDGVPSVLALAEGVLVGVLLGVLTYGVMALLRDASRLARLIATLGLFGVGQSVMVLRWGDVVVQPASMLPSRNVTLWGELTIGLDRLLLIGIALACAGVLRLIYTGTLFGLATSAVAENRRVAASAGWSPGRIELANFAIAGGLSALAAILLAPIVSLNAAVLSIAVLPGARRRPGRPLLVPGHHRRRRDRDRDRPERDLAVPTRHRPVVPRQRAVADGPGPGRSARDHPRLHGVERAIATAAR